MHLTRRVILQWLLFCYMVSLVPTPYSWAQNRETPQTLNLVRPTPLQLNTLRQTTPREDSPNTQPNTPVTQPSTRPVQQQTQQTNKNQDRTKQTKSASPLINSLFNIQVNTPSNSLPTTPRTTQPTPQNPRNVTTSTSGSNIDLTVVGTPTVQNNQVSVTVQNIGNHTSPETSVTLFIYGPIYSSDATVKALAPGNKVTVILTPPTGVDMAGKRYQVMVDAHNQVAESNEANNRPLTAIAPSAPNASATTPNNNPTPMGSAALGKSISGQSFIKLSAPKLHTLDDIQEMAKQLPKYQLLCSIEANRITSVPAIPGQFPDGDPLQFPSARKSMTIQNDTSAPVTFLLHSPCGPSQAPKIFALQVATAPVEDSDKAWYNQPTVIDQVIIPITPLATAKLPEHNKVTGSSKGSFYYVTLNLTTQFNSQSKKLDQWLFEHWEKDWAEGATNHTVQSLNFRFLPIASNNTNTGNTFSNYQVDGSGSDWLNLSLFPSQSAYTERMKNQAIANYYDDQAQKEAETKADFAQLKQIATDFYTVEFLSYIPPKFSDDPDAPNYLRMNHSRMVHFGGDQYHGEQDLYWGKGDSYNATAASNILQSNTTVWQEMYNLGTAILDGTSAAFAQAKEATVGGIAKGINKIGIVDCSKTCQSVLMTGLNFALAYAGIPPNLPNSQNLYSKGASFLASSMAGVAVDNMGSDLLGSYIDSSVAELKQQIPPEYMAASWASDVIYAEAKRRAKNKVKDAIYSQVNGELVKFTNNKLTETPVNNDNPYTWGTPDPVYRKHPPTVYIRIKPTWVKSYTDTVAAQYDNVTLKSVQIQFSNGQYLNSDPISIELNHLPEKGIVLPVVVTPNAVNWPYVYNSACGASNVPCTLEGWLGRLEPGYGQPIYNLSGDEPMVISTVHELRHPKHMGRVDTVTIERIKTSINPGFVNPMINGKYPTEGFYGELKTTSVQYPH